MTAGLPDADARTPDLSFEEFATLRVPDLNVFARWPRHRSIPGPAIPASPAR